MNNEYFYWCSRFLADKPIFPLRTSTFGGLRVRLGIKLQTTEDNNDYFNSYLYIYIIKCSTGLQRLITSHLPTMKMAATWGQRVR